MTTIPLSSPDITQKEIEAVTAVLKTPNLSLGPKVTEFERNFTDYLGTKHALAVNSGTSGLHLCVRSLGIGEGDEVITSPFSFIASSNCVLFERARPVFVDIREDTLNIDECRIEEKITKNTKAIIPVHVFGFPCDMPSIAKIAKKHNLKVIEDACEALGAEINGKKVGSFGNGGIFAFYPNKQITTGEGGMVVSDDDVLIELARSMRNQGRDEGMKWLAHDRLGYNYRLSDINCAIGVAQMSRVRDILARRENVAEMYRSRLSDIEEIILPPQNRTGTKRSWFVYVVRLREGFSAEKRDRIIRKMKERGIGASNYFPPIHLQPFYREQFGYKRGDFKLTEQVADQTIALPFFNNLKAAQIDRVAENLKIILREVG